MSSGMCSSFVVFNRLSSVVYDSGVILNVLALPSIGGKLPVPAVLSVPNVAIVSYF